MNLLESMAVFVQVVERGSLSAASDFLGMSATMVGKHLRNLEHHLEMQLLYRTTRRQSLTTVGGNYYQHCKNVLEMVAEGEAMVRQEQQLPSGKLRVSAPVVFGNYALMPFIAAYMKRYPSAVIDLQLTDRIVDVVNDDIDVAIRIGSLPDSTNVIARKLTTYQLALCASTQYLKLNGVPQTPQDLMLHQCLSLSPRVLEEWQGNPSWAKSLVGGFISDSSEALRQAALAHMGIVLLSRFLISDDIQTGRLSVVLKKYPLPARDIHVLYPRQRYKVARLSCFLDALQAAFLHDPMSSPSI